MARPLLLRTDARFDIGTGHLMRLLALADAWRSHTRGGKIILLGDVAVAGLRQRLEHFAIEFQSLAHPYPETDDLATLASLTKELRPAWIVLDGYHFDADYQFAARALGFPLLVIDDFAHHRSYSADLLLNANPDATQLSYNLEPNTRLLFGSRFCLLRPELRTARDANSLPVAQYGRKLLITMGGADSHGLSFLALQAFAELGTEWEAKIVLGSANQRGEELRNAAAGYPNVEILADVQNMGALMLWADLALAAAGTTTWELAYLGVPALLIVTADNQIRVAAAAQSLGCAINLGWWENLTITDLISALRALAANFRHRRNMTNVGRRTIDGKGAVRVVRAMIMG